VRRALAFLLATATTATTAIASADQADKCADDAEAGQSLRDDHKLVDARTRFLSCAQAACPKEVRSDCADFLEETKKLVPSVVFRVHGKDGQDLTNVVVKSGDVVLARTLDGTANDVDPGPYTFRFEAPGLPPKELKILVAEGEQQRIVEISLGDQGAAGPAVPSEAGGGPGPLPWIVGGVGVAGLGAFAVLQGLAASEYGDVEDRCGAAGTCTDDDLDPLRIKYVSSAVSLGVGVACLATATVLFFTLDSSDSVSASPTADGGAYVAFRHRF